MRLPPFRRISREDIPQAEDWVGRLLHPINSVFEALASGLNKGITFEENIQSFSKTLQFTTDATYTSGSWNALSFAIPDTFKVRASGLWIIKGGPTVESASDISGIYVNWSENERTISINWLGGLADSTKYNFTFMVI